MRRERGRGAAGDALRYREGREGAALSARRALSSPRPLLAAVPASKRNSRPLQSCTICTAQLAPDNDGRALEDPSAVVKAELRVVFDALRCARPGSARVPGPLAAAEKLIPTGQPTQRCRADFVTDDGALAPVVNPGDAGLALPVVCDVRVDLWRGERNRFTRGDGDGA